MRHEAREEHEVRHEERFRLRAKRVPFPFVFFAAFVGFVFKALKAGPREGDDLSVNDAFIG